jgi:hypothetical protein
MTRKPTKKTAKQAATRRLHGPRSGGSLLDRAIEMIKWVDNPFKLIVLILLGTIGLSGWIVYQNQDKLMTRFVLSEHMPILVSDERIVSLSTTLMRDLRAEAILVHEINLSSNARITRVALSRDGRYTSLEGHKGAFFSGSPARNHAAVSMLNGEVLCETFEASSEAGEWFVSKGVSFACRGSIPPEQGSMVGYLSIGFKSVPKDITATKARINQTTRELAR